ncbi:T9SS type A sorting domain-containing protein [candidate division KSB1 bacterium]|nr:T9SS type A sorting domain-containing protein [candidate division KSB1 bacterium]
MNQQKLMLCLVLMLSLQFSLNLELAWGQLVNVWYLETPAAENHWFHGIAPDLAGQKLYITDNFTEQVYIYANNQSNVPIESISHPSWHGGTQSYFGPYGVDISLDNHVYIAVWNDDDLNGDGKTDHGLWRYSPNNKQLTQLCYLPEAPRGLHVHGLGKLTVVYVAGNYGSVIRCTPKLLSQQFKTEILFNTTIQFNQQDALANLWETMIYVSSPPDNLPWSGSPYASSVLKWDRQGNLDGQFSTAYFPMGTVPGISFNPWQNALYVFFIGMSYFDETRIYKIQAETGQEIHHVQVSDGGYSPGGGLNANWKGEIYFARTFEQRNGYWISAYGMVRDTDAFNRVPDLPLTENQRRLTLKKLNDYDLAQNYPNPFNPTTTITYSLSKDSQVTLTIYNTLGQVVAVLVAGFQTQGSHRVQWDGQDQPSGLYLYQLEAEGFTVVRKMFLQK